MDNKRLELSQAHRHVRDIGRVSILARLKRRMTGSFFIRFFILFILKYEVVVALGEDGKWER